VKLIGRGPALCLVLTTLVACGGRSSSSTVAGRQRETVRVAAASDLRFALEAVSKDFRQAHPSIAVVATYGSSGLFFSQIQNGAPFDVYLSADATYPRRLQAEGLTLPGSEFDYAVGRIVLWVPNGSGIALGTLGMRALTDPEVKKISIANPEHAPYGKAAVVAMEHFGVYQDAKGKLVLGENISQALQFAQSGGADIGIVALSLVKAPGAGGRYWEIPSDSYPPIQQAGVILRSARDLSAARAFTAFMTSPEGQAILRRFGFSTPGG
jgi:molybdate transport system substrate-binding protein